MSESIEIKGFPKSQWQFELQDPTKNARDEFVIKSPIKAPEEDGIVFNRLTPLERPTGIPTEFSRSEAPSNLLSQPGGDYEEMSCSPFFGLREIEACQEKRSTSIAHIIFRIGGSRESPRQTEEEIHKDEHYPRLSPADKQCLK